MKKIALLFLIIIGVIIFQSSTKKVTSSGAPPPGYTGATGNYCTSCHSDFAVNSGGGTVSTSGLPLGSYTAGQQYNFSLTITHASANRRRWGFAIRAVNSVGQNIGTFSTTNSNAFVNSGEMAHLNAITTGLQASYTYNNLRWTAPVSPGTNDKNVTFYYVGNAGDGNGGSGGDFIYANSSSTVLPATLENLQAKVHEQSVSISFKAVQQVNIAHFEVEKSVDAQLYYTVGKLAFNTEGKYSFTDNNPSYFNKPIYYRIKVIDKDGSFKYSTTLTVTVAANNILLVKAYPTMVTKGTIVTADIYSKEPKVLAMQIVDINGKVLQNSTIKLVAGNNKYNFQIAHAYNTNWLFVKFLADKNIQTIPLIMQ